MRARPRSIAIDGPAGSGKTTIGAELARRLGYAFLDTGMVYRATTLAAVRCGVSVHDEAALVALIGRVQIAVSPPAVDDGRVTTITLDGEDVTWALRERVVDDNVSPVSAHPLVRDRLLGVQRSVASQGPVVMVGRDIGTVILPGADLKVYLDASVEERARRRQAELQARGVASNYDEVLDNLRQRDAMDSGRSVAPLAQAPDAHYVDSTSLSVDSVLQHIEDLVRGCHC
ncbi:MAG: (d)CMP kinase [Anaerolineae bacterium]|nr:(d)CMP kinase [Anaerolineae bacterium]